MCYFFFLIWLCFFEGGFFCSCLSFVILICLYVVWKRIVGLLWCCCGMGWKLGLWCCFMILVFMFVLLIFSSLRMGCLVLLLRELLRFWWLEVGGRRMGLMLVMWKCCWMRLIVKFWIGLMSCCWYFGFCFDIWWCGIWIWMWIMVMFVMWGGDWLNCCFWISRKNSVWLNCRICWSVLVVCRSCWRFWRKVSW